MCCEESGNWTWLVQAVVSGVVIAVVLERAAAFWKWRRQREQIEHLRRTVQDAYRHMWARNPPLRRERLFRSLRSTLDVMLQHRVPDLTYKQLAAVREALTNTERYFSQAGIGPTPDMDIFDARFFTTLEGLDWLRRDLDSIREATPHGEPD